MPRWPAYLEHIAEKWNPVSSDERPAVVEDDGLFRAEMDDPRFVLFRDCTHGVTSQVL